MPIYKLGVDVWIQTIITNELIGPLITRSILYKVDKVRHKYMKKIKNHKGNGDLLDTTYIISKFMDMKIVLSVDSFLASESVERYKHLYANNIEKGVIMKTQEFYRNYMKSMASSNIISEYVDYIERVFWFEREVNKFYFYPRTCHEIIKSMEEELIINRMSFIRSELDILLDTNSIDDLHKIYDTFIKIGVGVDCIMTQFDSFLRNGFDNFLSSLTTRDEIGKEIIDNLIKLYRVGSNIIKNSFGSDSRLKGLRDRAFRDMINSSRLKNDTIIFNAAESFSVYCDSLLTKDSKVYTRDQKHEIFDDIVCLFACIDDKDGFLLHYSKFMSRRLILEKFESFKSEILMVEKLKAICGVEYITNLQKMLSDFETSQGINTDIGCFCVSKSSIKGNVIVGTYGPWPLTHNNTNSEFTPSIIKTLKKMYEKYYTKILGERVLVWVDHLTHVNIEFKKGTFDKQYTFTVDPRQLLIFELYTKNVLKLSIRSIMELTHMDAKTLVMTIKSLVDSSVFSIDYKKYNNFDVRFENNIWKDTEGPGFDEIAGCNLELNTSYTNENLDVTLVRIFKDDKKVNTLYTKTPVDDDRKPYMEALVARIMKEVREIDYFMLIKRIEDGMCGKFGIFTTKIIDEIIDRLISKGFIEKHPVKPDVFLYIS